MTYAEPEPQRPEWSHRKRDHWHNGPQKSGTKPARKQSRRNSGTDGGWKTSSDQERRRRNAHCHRARPALSGGKSFGGSPQCLHPSHHQNHARQAEPPSHCANDHRRSRRGPYTLRESSQLLRGPQPPRRSNTPHCAAKHTIPVNACGQREVLTVVTHPTPTTML